MIIMANKIYVMKDDSDKLKNAVVTYGALQASIEGNTIYIGSADATPKASAGLSLSPTSVSLNAYQPVTVTATHLGDGLVKCYNNQFIKVEQINATDFKLIPQFAGEGKMGFWLDETATYYGAAANVSITAENTATAFLMHFDDAEEPFLNLGTASITSIEGSYSIESGGKFGSYLNATSATNLWTSQALGGKDFTVEFDSNALTTFIYVMWNASEILGVSKNEGNYEFYAGANHTATNKPILSEWQHIAQ